MKRAALLTLAVFALSTQALLAQEHPNQARGFEAAKVYQLGEVDQVNLFNGNLSLTIPIGQRYPVNAGFSYGLVLTYNSNLWKYEEDENFTPPNIFTPAVVARPDPIWNAGFGWMLHMGRLFAPSTPTFNDSVRWVYLSPDGSRHTFYPTLHEGETDGPSGGSFWYTRDNTYLRLDSANRTVEFPDGTKHSFSAHSQVSRIEDRHENYVDVNTSSATQWTLIDRLGRTQTIWFVKPATGLPCAVAIEGAAQVCQVDLRAFNGQTATYTFLYENAMIYRTSKDTWWGNNNPPNASGVDQITVPLLMQITGPDGFVVKMQDPPGVADYHRGGPSDPAVPWASGVIQSLELPTKGKLSWTYQLWRFPGYDGSPRSTRAITPSGASGWRPVR